ncbi:Ankyrin unc44 [Colletotrichum scovillei]|nr:Ankyrin unc44 [Colletotrichum scovillei]
MKGSKFVRDSELFKVTPLHDLFLPDYHALEAHQKSNEEIACAIKAAFNLIMSHPLAAEAVSSYGNYALGCPSSNLMARILRSFWMDGYIYYTRDFGRYTPLQLFFVHPFSDDPEIPQAMFDLVQDGRDQINTVIKPLYITPLLALLGHRFDHSLGDANFYRPKLLKWLLEHGADPNLCDREGFSPLHYAVFWLDAPAVELLLLHGARVKREDELQVMDVLFGGVFTREHHKEAKRDRPSRRSEWTQMVKQIEIHAWSMQRVGSNIERWQPGTPLPACTLFNFESNFTFDMYKEVALPSELVTRWGGLREALRGDADERRKRIFAALLPTPNVLPFLKPRGIMERDGEVNLGEHGSDPETIRYSVLDWAMATAQDDWFLDRIKRLGGETGDIRPETWLKTYDP